MKTRFATLLALLALASLGLAACGGDDDDSASEPPATTEEATTEEETTDAPSGGSTASFTADPTGKLEYEEESAEAEAGQVELDLTNESQVPHDVRVESPEGADLGGTEQITGDTATATVDLEAGDYTFYCSVPGHREAGMEGPLTVE